MTLVKNLCVYCGSTDAVAKSLLESAATLGRDLARGDIRLVYGGGRVGLMGQVADACLAAGGAVLGVIPQHLFDRELAHPGLTKMVTVASMHERKRIMSEQADAFAILPGGFGTLDEFFEILTWRQLGLHDKPIVVVNQDGYWDELLHAMNKIVEAGFASPRARRRFDVVADAGQVLPWLQQLPAPLLPTDSAKF